MGGGGGVGRVPLRFSRGLKGKGSGYSLQILARTSLWAMGERFDNSITQWDINKKGRCIAQQPFLFSFSG